MIRLTTMNKNIFAIFFFILLCSFRGISQIYSPLKECGYEELMNKYKVQGCQFFNIKPSGNRDDETVLKIPVVFHVVVPCLEFVPCEKFLQK